MRVGLSRHTFLGVGRQYAAVPETVARTVVEQSLRALYQLSDRASPEERAERRLNEWLYAIDESERLQQAILDYEHPNAEGVERLQAMRTRA